ncbi:MAG: RsmB/NOP family class I SAM-dependent RNA methyltransferase [Sphingomonadaceae bacterium]
MAAIEIVDAIIVAARTGGAAADTLIQRYFSTRRYAGSKDRAAVRELVYAAIRYSAELPASGRAALLGLTTTRPELLPLFDGSAHAPALPAADEPRAAPGLVPAWLIPAFLRRFGASWQDEATALLGRAPLDLRVNSLRTADPDAVASALPVQAQPIPGLPLGLRLETPVALDHHPLMHNGSIEVQDAASQHSVALANPRPGDFVIDLCAGAGGKTLALAAAMAGEGRILATDVDRARLTAMGPRLARSGAEAMVERRLLNPNRESGALADVAGQADLVFVDAPCSGTGTWRRNPELRWRLTPKRLEQLIAVQHRLIALAQQLVRPGGRLAYAVCSVMREEGADQVMRALPAPDWREVARAEFSPAREGCDGFFVATMEKCP